MDRAELLNDLEEAQRLLLDGRQSTIWTCLPAIVQSVNWDEMTVEAQPTIQGIVTNEDGTQNPVNLPLLINVPLVFPSGGGFIITMPIAAGDEVLVVFASRCIDAWWQSSGIQVPMEARMHDLSDGFAIPGPRSLPKIPAGSINATALQIRNDAGTSYVEISADGKIKLVSPSEIDITAPLVNVTGNLLVSGTITGPGAIGLTTHKHSGVTTGVGTSGGPVP